MRLAVSNFVLIVMLLTGCLSSNKESFPVAPPIVLLSKPAPPLKSTLPERYIETQTRLGLFCGSVYKSQEGEWKSAKPGDRVQPGEAIVTSSNSAVEIFVNGSIVCLGPDSMLSIETSAERRKVDGDEVLTRLKLNKGILSANVRTLTQNSLYEIAMPNGIAQVNGTDLMACSNGKLACINGRIVFRGLDHEYLLNKGEFFDPTRKMVRTSPALVQSFIKYVYLGGPLGVRPTTFCNQSSPYDAGVTYARRCLRGIPMRFFFDVDSLTAYHCDGPPSVRINQKAAEFCDGN